MWVGMYFEFTHHGSPAAAARRAHRFACVQRAAGVGQRRYLFGSMKSECWQTDHASRWIARRRATVTISVPLAARASHDFVGRKFPRADQGRDENSRPAIFKGPLILFS
jgi:hypothetical protein